MLPEEFLFLFLFFFSSSSTLYPLHNTCIPLWENSSSWVKLSTAANRSDVAFIVDIWVFSRLLPVQSCKTGNGFYPHIVAGKHLLIPLLFPRLPSQEAYVLSSLSQSLRHVNHLFIRPSPDTNVTDKAIEDQNKNMLCVHWVECWHKVWLMHC